MQVEKESGNFALDQLEVFLDKYFPKFQNIYIPFVQKQFDMFESVSWTIVSYVWKMWTVFTH